MPTAVDDLTSSVVPFDVCSLRELSVPVTAKIRALEKDEDTLDLARRLEAAGAQMLTGAFIDDLRILYRIRAHQRCLRIRRSRV